MLALLPLLAAAVAAAAAPEEFAEIPRADSSGSVVGDSEPSPPAPALAAGAGGANITCCVSYPIPGNSTPAGCDGGTAYKHDGGTYHYNTDRGTPTAACGQAARCACCRTGPKTAACGPPPPPPPPEKLSFLSATLGSHMVLQRAPQQAVVWGFTAPGAKVTTTMSSGSSSSSTPEETLASFVATAGADGTWRQKLPPTAASKTAYSFTFASDSAAKESASMIDVLFGDVYLCGGQSNMEFAMPAVANRTRERQAADHFPTIRFFSVGHRTASIVPLRDLQSIWEPWQVASNVSINKDYGPGHTLFSTFSAVCWLFGKELSTQLSAAGDVPLGLVSNNWGGTKVEVWSPAEAYDECNRTDIGQASGPMYNAMILPYAAGPMALSGITWYQGEANTESAESAAQYSCLFPAMITAWRAAFEAPALWFGFVQLSTWCATPPASIPQMREAQMAALALPNVGYATNADHGFGCSIHPAAKQYCSVRLAHSALAMHYGKKHIAWKSPSYRAATRLATTTTAATDADGAAEGGRGSTVVSVSVQLNDVSAAGLRTVHPANYDPPQYGSNWSRVPSDGQFVAVDCAATFPAAWPNKTKYNASMELQCAWAAVEVGGSWLNATVAIAPGGQSLILTTSVPPTVTATAATATSYGWGPIPMMNIYNKDSDLPVLAWNKTL